MPAPETRIYWRQGVHRNSVSGALNRVLSITRDARRSLVELLDTAKRIGNIPIRFVLWRAVDTQDWRLLDDYIHALEDYVEALSNVCDSLGHTVRALHRQRKALERHRTVLDRDIDQFLGEEKENLAIMAQHRLMTLARLDATYDRLIRQQEREQARYTDIRLLLEAKLSEARRRREELLDALRGGDGSQSALPADLTPDPAWDVRRLWDELQEALELDTLRQLLAERRERLVPEVRAEEA